MATPLPQDLTPFIGRQQELAELRRLFASAENRLISILGPGGAGKTRLALELAASLHAQFQHGIVFIPLAHLRTPTEFLPAVVTALEIYLPLGGDLRQAVLEHLGPKQLLLIFDNFDNLLDMALLVRDFLAHAPQVKVLVTSRQKLNLQGEILYHLSGLHLPPSTAQENLASYDAIRLFIQRAQLARPGFSLDDYNASPVAQTCRLVDGMPLGILLAAAWMEHFSPHEIANHISRSLDFLSQELRDIPERHRSMRAVFDASFDRLTAEQQSLFGKLAVFRGGFDLPAAAAVTGAEMKLLFSLVEKSLLQRDPDAARFDLHELLRQYAMQKLAQAGDQESTHTAHAAYYLSLVHQLEEQLKSSSQSQALDAIQTDFDNISLAWSWAVDHRDLRAIQLAAPPLYAFCDMRSRYHEGEALFQAVRRGCSPASSEKPHPAWALGLLSWYDLLAAAEKLAAVREVASQAELCLAQSMERLGPQGLAASQVLLGAIAQDRQDYPAAIRYYRQGMQLYPQLDDFYWVTMRIGLCCQASQDYQSAVHYFGESYRRGSELGERVKMAWALLNLGETSALQGDRSQAEQYLLDSRQLFQQVGTLVGVLWTDYSLSRLALEQGQLDRSRELAESALQIARHIHSASWLAKVDHLFAQVGLSTGSSTPIAPSIYEPLSQRELEVLSLLKSDLSGPEIAQRLYVTLNTVRYHSKNIYRKLQVNNRREATRRALELGI